MQHSYASAGMYTVGLNVIDGTCSDFTEVQIEVFDAPVASFTAPNGCTNTNIPFTNTSTGGGTYSWNFEDGNSSALTAPLHAFDEPGTFNVELVQTNGCGSDNTIVAVEIADAPSASFTLNAASCIADEVLPGIAPESGVSYTWTWGDGAQDVTNTPVHVYSTAGEYTLALLADNGLCSANSSQLITVLETPQPGTAINGSTALCPNETVTLQGTLGNYNTNETNT